MTNEQILLGLLAAGVGLITFLVGLLWKGKQDNAQDPSGNRSTDFWLRQFDKLIEAQVRCESRQEAVLERLDKLIEIMEAK